ncbi:MAG TPA: hypothetical protein VHW73_13365 [Rudaea sp.]|jgi:hypothetical protein|nr:hypothetical protein [Rudaea sp.]
MSNPAVTNECCERCVHFERDPLAIERAVPGLNVMSSGFASVRADDGLCRHHDRHVSARATCATFAARPSG